MRSKKRFIAIILSVLLHAILIAFILARLDKKVETFNNFKPTATKGITISLLNPNDLPTPPTLKPAAQPSASSGLDIKPMDAADITLKSAKPKAGKVSKTPTKNAKPAKPHVVKPASKSHINNVSKIHKPVEKVITIAEPVVNNQHPDNSNTQGSGADYNSSTNGSGNQNGAFDFRLIQYSRDAADAIQQNFYWPQNYKPMVAKFRAIVVLDKNMQFQSLKVLNSTGVPDLDNSIIKALKSTIYPPLPQNADWNQYHIIDYHSSIN